MHEPARYLTILSLAGLLPLAACESPSSPDGTGLSPEMQAHRHAVAVPFRAEGFTVLESLAPDPRCGAPPRFLNTQVGEGEATHLGRFSVRFTFCVDISDLLDDGRLTEGESAPYDQGEVVFVAADGSELHGTIAGAVLPSEDPDFDFQFRDPLVFVGGTGRFAGASGEVVDAGSVVQATNRTEHEIEGTLIMRPGR